MWLLHLYGEFPELFYRRDDYMYCLLLPPLFQRMIIGLRAFLLIADSLEKDEGDPPMPMNVGPLPSGGTPRVKTKFLSTTLTDETAKKIGIAPFYPTSVHTSFHIYTCLDSA